MPPRGARTGPTSAHCPVRVGPAGLGRPAGASAPDSKRATPSRTITRRLPGRTLAPSPRPIGCMASVISPRPRGRLARYRTRGAVGFTWWPSRITAADRLSRSNTAPIQPGSRWRSARSAIEAMRRLAPNALNGLAHLRIRRIGVPRRGDRSPSRPAAYQRQCAWVLGRQ